MNFKPELVLGTAEFGHSEYVPHPSKLEIVKILNLAYNSGIKWLDTADTYNTESLEPLFYGFKQLHKSRTNKDSFYHYDITESPIKGLKRASVYTLEQTEGLEEAIIPFSIANTTFKDVRLSHVWLRSVFDRGNLLEAGYSVKDCLDFVKRRRVDGIVVGVRSLLELEEILNVY